MLELKLADGTSTLAAAGGFRYGGELIGAIVVARPVRSISASTLVQGRRVVPPLLLAVAAAALVALLLSRRITRPVQELTEASEQIARGDYDVQLTSKGPDELGQLALRFEQMARQLKEASEHERNFLMRISHELRTPLTAIQGHVQAIADGVIEGEEEQQASLEIVLAEAGRLQRLIGDLLDLARLETRKFSLNVEEVDLVEVCESAAGAQREEARGRHVKLHVRAEAKPVVVGDGDRILQIVTNLVTNALHATPADGDVAVDVALARRHGAGRRERHGPGHPRGGAASILRPFVTSDVRHGIGLGLPVASELAIAMGGTIVVGDRAGRRRGVHAAPAAGADRPRSGNRAAAARASRRPSSSPSRRPAPPGRARERSAPRRARLLGLRVADLGDGLLELVNQRRRDGAADLVVDRGGNRDEQRGDRQHDADVFDRALTPFGVQDPRGPEPRHEEGHWGELLRSARRRRAIDVRAAWTRVVCTGGDRPPFGSASRRSSAEPLADHLKPRAPGRRKTTWW